MNLLLHGFPYSQAYSCAYGYNCFGFDNMLFTVVASVVCFRQSKIKCRDNVRAISKLHAAVESCKRVLSTMNSTLCSIDSLHDGMDFNSTLTRLVHLGCASNRHAIFCLLHPTTDIFVTICQSNLSTGRNLTVKNCVGDCTMDVIE